MNGHVYMGSPMLTVGSEICLVIGGANLCWIDLFTARARFP